MSKEEYEEIIRDKIRKLKYDKEFIRTHNRKRTYREIARLIGYSERQLYRFLQNKKD